MRVTRRDILPTMTHQVAFQAARTAHAVKGHRGLVPSTLAR
jgi:hypothetical protein